MSGRGFSGCSSTSVPVFVNVAGTKTTSLLDSYGKRNVSSSVEVVDSSGISRTIIGPYQIPSDTTKSWYLDVWDGELKEYRTLLLPTNELFDITEWSPVTTPTTTVNFVADEVPSGVINGSNVLFTLAATPLVNTVVVHINGLRLHTGTLNDYTVSGKILTFNYAPIVGDVLTVDYCK